MRIHQHNVQMKTHGGQQINLKGILVGNGCTDWTVDATAAMPEFLYMHNVMDKDTYAKWVDNKCEDYAGGTFPSVLNEKCIEV